MRFPLKIGQDIVGFWPTKNTVIVAHEGTDPMKLYVPPFIPNISLNTFQCRLSVLTSASLVLGDLDPNLFPGLPSGVQVHHGFLDEHAETIAVIFDEVQRLLAKTGATSVTCVRILPCLDLHIQPSHHGLLTGWSFARRRAGPTRLSVLHLAPSIHDQHCGHHIRHPSSGKRRICRVLRLKGEKTTG